MLPSSEEFCHVKHKVILAETRKKGLLGRDSIKKRTAFPKKAILRLVDVRS